MVVFNELYTKFSEDMKFEMMFLFREKSCLPLLLLDDVDVDDL